MKVIMFANTDWYLYKRLSLICAIRSQGHEVILMSPPRGYSHGDYSHRLEREGLRWIPFPMSRSGLNPIRELMALIRLIYLYRKERPDLVHHFTIKCVLYGSLASHIAGVKARVNAVPGLGHLFIDNSIKSRALRFLVKLLYRLALRHTSVIFQNSSDRRFFIEHGLVSAENSCLIRGSGVDTKRFRPMDKAGEGDKKYVLLASRLLWTKGLAEYVEAAGIVRKSLSNVVFQIAGETDAGNPAAVPESVIDEWARQCDVELLGYRDDIENLLRQVSIAVLPTYGEGIPRILIEAAACGLPLVATDIPGCREIVHQGINGFLVPVKDSQRLADSILTLLEDDKLRIRMGRMSRQIACDEFEQELVINNTMAVYRNHCRA